MGKEQFVVRFWGTRGSYPVPGPSTVRYGGNTTCVEVAVGKQIIIIDAGTGIINLGHEMMRKAQEQGNKPIVATILLTHMHHDHTQGFPYFIPAYVGTSILHILGPRTFDREIEEILNHSVLPPSFPVSLQEMPSVKVIRSLLGSEIILIDQDRGTPHIYNAYHDHISYSPETIAIKVHKSYAHPRSGTYIYRIDWKGKSVVFASDTEGYVDTDRRLVNFARDADLIIHDAQYTEEEYALKKQGWGHSTPQMACDVARMANVKRLVLFHHEPLYDDDKIAEMERKAQEHYPNTIAAYEGLEISIA